MKRSNSGYVYRILPFRIDVEDLPRVPVTDVVARQSMVHARSAGRRWHEGDAVLDHQERSDHSAHVGGRGRCGGHGGRGNAACCSYCWCSACLLSTLAANTDELNRRPVALQLLHRTCPKRLLLPRRYLPRMQER